MAYRLQAQCTNCDYESDSLMVGNAKDVICFCKNCQSIVNASRPKYKFNYNPCPNCNASLFHKDSKWYDDQARNGPKAKCHQCHVGDINFKYLMHLRFRFPVEVPENGSIVYGTIDEFSGKLWVRNIFAYEADWQVDDLPEDLEGKYFELLVLSSELKDGKITSIRLKFLNFLDNL